MPAVELGDMLGHARCHGYAVGAFTVPGLDVARGVLAAAERARAPVVLAVDPASDEEAALESRLAGLVTAVDAASVPAALLYGPAPDAAAVRRAARLGCGGLLARPPEGEFTAAVTAVRQQVVEAATCRLTVIASPHPDESGRTPAAEAAALSQRTACHALEVAIAGHAEEGQRSRTDYARLRQLGETTECPLAVSADGRATDDRIRRMVAQGAAQIGFSEGLARAAADALRAAAPAYENLSRAVRDGVSAWSGERMRATGSAGRAAEVLSRCRERRTVEELLIQEETASPDAVEQTVRAGEATLRAAPGVRTVHGYRVDGAQGRSQVVWRVELCHPAARAEFADHLRRLPGGPIRHLSLEPAGDCPEAVATQEDAERLLATGHG
ncbi:MAG: class II fructose-bisphosphate aldolase [Thiohalospira sp.]